MVWIVGLLVKLNENSQFTRGTLVKFNENSHSHIGTVANNSYNFLADLVIDGHI